MIRGIGVDIVGVHRFEDWVEDSGKLNRFFHPGEIEWCAGRGKGAAASFAARFAAREAFSKALGKGIVDFGLKDLEVCRDEFGKPYIKMYQRAQEALKACGGELVHLSLSHERDYAVATVVIE